MLSNYVQMRAANTIGADKYFHCKANCDAVRQGPGSSGMAKFVSDLRELYGRLKGDPPSDEQADREANRLGREQGIMQPEKPCEEICEVQRPRGLQDEYQ